MRGDQPVVRRVDHVIIRVDDPYYDQLYALLSETFQLPTPWPINEQPGFKSGGIFAGNVDFEILRVAPNGADAQAASPEAEIYGVVFEAYSAFADYRDDLGELAERGVPYIPTPYVVDSDGGQTDTWWVNIFLGRLLGSNRWMDLFFLYKRLIPDSLWLRLASSGFGNNQAGARFLFDKVYANGIVFLVKYNPTWRDIDAERDDNARQLRSREGGPLGVTRVKSIEVGLRDFAALRTRWQALLAPHTAVDESTWQVGDGPAIRLVPDSRNKIRSMVWQVGSLERAEAFLRSQGMFGGANDGEIVVDPAALFGLDIRLVE